MNKIKNIFIICITLFVITSSISSIAGAQGHYKSGPKAFFSSLLLPGLGQYYVGSKSAVKYFAGAEVLLLGVGIGLEEYSDWLVEDYRTFAAEKAGVSIHGKSKVFMIEMSKYNSIYIYNEQMRIEREFESVLPETPDNVWVWQSDEDRIAFHYKRVDADTYGNRAVFFYTGVFVNHLVSGIHAAIMAKKYNSRQAEIGETNWNVRAVPNMSSYNPGLKLKVSYSF
ncbi:hypothetical protein ACFL67_00285 [candidate division KSB1 bacterium]